MSVFVLLESKIRKTIEKYKDLLLGRPEKVKVGMAFLLYSLENMFKNFQFETLENGIVDSSYRGEIHDYGIDAVYVTASNQHLESVDTLNEYNEDTKFVFHIIQCKKGKSLDQACLLKLKEGIEVVFINDDIVPENNTYFFNRMTEIYEIRNTLYERFSADQIKIKIYIVFGGLKENIEKEPLLVKQLDEIEKMLHENGYTNTEIILEDINNVLKNEKMGDEIIDIVKTEKSFKYITDTNDEKKLTGYISILKGEEIAKLVKKYQSQLFEANIRDFYRRSDLNSNIVETCSNINEAKYFWSFNNGLTITCNKVEELPGDRFKLYGCQVVNGCQTSNALYLAYANMMRKEELDALDKLTKDNQSEYEKVSKLSLNNDSTLLVKIIETKSQDLTYRITETTNSQTPIKTFSLKANDDIQKQIEDYLLSKGIYYERRINYYKNMGKRNIVTIQKLFQLYVAQIQFKPSQAKTNPKSIFETNYDKIFPSPRVSVKNFILYLIPIKVDIRLMKHIRLVQRGKLESDPYKIMLLSYGKLHLGVLLLYGILGKGYSEKIIVEKSQMILDTLEDESLFSEKFNKALEDLKTIIQSNYGKRKESVPAAVRKTDLDNRIARFIKK